MQRRVTASLVGSVAPHYSQQIRFVRRRGAATTPTTTTAPSSGGPRVFDRTEPPPVTSPPSNFETPGPYASARPTSSTFGLQQGKGSGFGAATSNTIERIRMELAEMKQQQQQQQQQVEQDSRDSTNGNTSGGGNHQRSTITNTHSTATALVTTTRQPAPFADSVADQVLRSKVLGDGARRDMEEVLRGSEAKRERLLQALPGLDPLAQENRKKNFDRMQSHLKRMSATGKPMEDIIASLDDETLLDAMRCGALDPAALLMLDEDDESDLGDDDHNGEMNAGGANVREGGSAEDEDEEEGEDMAEDRMDVSSLLPELFLENKELSQLTRTLADDLDGRPTEDVCTVLQKTEGGDYSELLEEDIQLLEAFEKSQNEHYTAIPNRVLQLAATLDEEVAHSLEVLDTIRRKSVTDPEFNAALEYSAASDAAAFHSRPIKAKPVKPDPLAPYYVDSPYSRLPPRASSGVPSNIRMTRNQKQKERADRLKMIGRTGRHQFNAKPPSDG